MRQGPWTGRYPAAAAMVIFALVPYLVLSSALQPITPIIARDLHMRRAATGAGAGGMDERWGPGLVFAAVAGPNP
jgi:hypothetical protein